MSKLSRRSFVRNTALALGTVYLARGSTSAWARPLGASDDVRIAVIGVGRKGSSHAENLLKTPGVRLVAVCDVDPVILAKQVEVLAKENVKVFATTDARLLLERADIDAVVIASPNHWHALHTVWACQAGKDVYVEKPVSHSVWEGVRMKEAAARHGRVVQAGTQMRSDIAMPEVIKYLREGHLGKMLWVHALCYKLRESIGNRRPWYPDWLDYDLYCGPAPVVPLRRDELHYDWHWSWDTGNGDLANIGIHEFDVGRWVAGHDGAPRRVLSLGGRYVVDDAAETPNTQLTVMDYAGVPVFLENRGLPAKSGVNYMDNVHGVRQGVYVQCEEGYFAGRHGGSFYDRAGRKLASFPGDGGADHMRNFLVTVRSRRSESLAAPLETGRVSTSTCLYGNISYRLGAPAKLPAARAVLEEVAPAAGALDNLARHLGSNGLDLDKLVLTLGPWLEVDAGLSDVTGVKGGGAATRDDARYLLKGTPRPPYVLPEPA